MKDLTICGHDFAVCVSRAWRENVGETRNICRHLAEQGGEGYGLSCPACSSARVSSEPSTERARISQRQQHRI